MIGIRIHLYKNKTSSIECRFQCIEANEVNESYETSFPSATKIQIV